MSLLAVPACQAPRLCSKGIVGRRSCGPPPEDNCAQNNNSLVVARQGCQRRELIDRLPRPTLGRKIAKPSDPTSIARRQGVHHVSVPGHHNTWGPRELAATTASANTAEQGGNRKSKPGTETARIQNQLFPKTPPPPGDPSSPRRHPNRRKKPPEPPQAYKCTIKFNDFLQTAPTEVQDIFINIYLKENAQPERILKKKLKNIKGRDKLKKKAT